MSASQEDVEAVADARWCQSSLAFRWTRLERSSAVAWAKRPVGDWTDQENSFVVGSYWYVQQQQQQQCTDLTLLAVTHFGDDGARAIVAVAHGVCQG